MTIIKPFRGYRYDQKAVGRLSEVVTPPYDVISKKQQAGYYKAHPNNFIRIDLGKIFSKDDAKNNRYIRAKGFLEEWIDSDILTRDGENSVYVYSQEYTVAGKKRARLGFISLARLEEDRTKGFLPHERTFKGPKIDRLELMKETSANLSPIFSLVFDDDKKIINVLKRAARSTPVTDVVFEGTRNRIWRMSDPRQIGALAKLMARKKALIADGHHRYEVALEYRRYMMAHGRPAHPQAYDYVMMYFATSEASGLTILPTHRMVEGISTASFRKNLEKIRDIFDIINVKDRAQMSARMKAGKGHIIGVYLGGRNYLCLELRRNDASGLIKSDNSAYWRNLDVVILHHLILEKALGLKGEKAEKAITFTRDPEVAFKWAASGKNRAAFFLNPPEMRDIYNIVRSRERMPHKTTYFYPKPLSGLVINRLG